MPFELSTEIAPQRVSQIELSWPPMKGGLLPDPCGGDGQLVVPWPSNVVQFWAFAELGKIQNNENEKHIKTGTILLTI